MKLKTALEKQKPFCKAGGGGGGSASSSPLKIRTSKITVRQLIFQSFYFCNWWYYYFLFKITYLITKEPRIVARAILDPVSDAELFDDEVQAFVLTGQTYGMRQMLTAMVSWPGQDTIQDMSTQIMFQNKINEIILSLPKDKRILHPFSTISTNKVLHMCFLVQKQKGHALALLEEIYKMQGEKDTSNTSSVFEIITVLFFFISIIWIF